MYQCGKVLWYKNTTGLENYIFHNIPVLTDLLAVFYSHERNRWTQRRESFVPFLDENGVSIELEQYDAFVRLFNRTAAMDTQLFSYLIQSETLFKSKTDLNIRSGGNVMCMCMQLCNLFYKYYYSCALFLCVLNLFIFVVCI